MSYGPVIIAILVLAGIAFLIYNYLIYGTNFFAKGTKVPVQTPFIEKINFKISGNSVSGIPSVNKGEVYLTVSGNFNNVSPNFLISQTKNTDFSLNVLIFPTGTTNITFSGDMIVSEMFVAPSADQIQTYLNSLGPNTNV